MIQCYRVPAILKHFRALCQEYYRRPRIKKDLTFLSKRGILNSLLLQKWIRKGDKIDSKHNIVSLTIRKSRTTHSRI